MKYCKKCNLLVKDDLNSCTKCGKALESSVSDKSPVVVVTASGFEKERICTVLTDNDIPYSVRVVTQKGIPTEMNAVTGNSKTAHQIVVPYEFYNKAMEQLVGINAVQLTNEELQSLTEALEEEESSNISSSESSENSSQNQSSEVESSL